MTLKQRLFQRIDLIMCEEEKPCAKNSSNANHSKNIFMKWVLCLWASRSWLLCWLFHIFITFCSWFPCFHIFLFLEKIHTKKLVCQKIAFSSGFSLTFYKIILLGLISKFDRWHKSHHFCWWIKEYYITKFPLNNYNFSNESLLYQIKMTKRERAFWEGTQLVTIGIRFCLFAFLFNSREPF